MKTSPVTVVLVAVASSLVTVGALELLRGARTGTPPAAAVEWTRESTVAAGEAEQPGPDARATDPVPGGGWSERLAELENRIAALEIGTRRAPVDSTPTATGAAPPGDDLRDLVLDWVEEERAARRRVAARENAVKQRQDLEFGARHQALMLAQEHDLSDWQRDEFAALFLEIGLRAREIEQSLDRARDSPAEVEARWVEYDEWVDQLERELTARLDPALYDEIYGED